MLIQISNWTPEQKEIYQKVQDDLIKLFDYIGSIEGNIGCPLLDYVLGECKQNISIANNTMIARVGNNYYDPDDDRDFPAIVEVLS